MSDLDARIAALMQLINEYAGHRIGVETMPGHVELDTFERVQDKAQSVETELEQAIRAELQKPALHEAIPDGLIEVLRGGRQCDEDGSEIIMSRQACREAADILESFLQGRAKPATADANFTTGDSDLDTLLELTVDMEQGKGNMDTGIFWLEILEKVKARLAEEKQSAQEEISDVEIEFIQDQCMERTEHGVKLNALKFARKVIRASKGEKT